MIPPLVHVRYKGNGRAWRAVVREIPLLEVTGTSLLIVRTAVELWLAANALPDHEVEVKEEFAKPSRFRGSGLPLLC